MFIKLDKIYRFAENRNELVSLTFDLELVAVEFFHMHRNNGMMGINI